MASGQNFTLNIKALFDASDVRAKVGDIQRAFNNLRLPDALKNNLQNSFTNVEKALSDFESRVAKGVKTKADASGLTRSMSNVITEFGKLENIVDKVQKEIGNSTDLSKIIKLDDKTLEDLRNLSKEIDEIQKKLNNVNSSKLEDLQKTLSEIKSGSGASKRGKEALELFEKGDIEGAISSLDKIIAKLEKLEEKARSNENNTDNVINSINKLRSMRATMVQAQTESADLIAQQNDKAAQSANILAQAYGQVTNSVNQGTNDIHQLGNSARSASNDVSNLATNQAHLNTELDQVKSRIQYFLGLSNAVNLFRRAVRSAFDTVKELDAAMTETAVVTNMTVSDMWNKLPEYTTRANQLGISTLEAYQAATLYYQQGLNDQQTAELSAETLRMARIAGLDAAEATDRMTNALRGFNMELDKVNAQKVDDVYSQLAAMSASNVDEISTAMTKVASLAHNANMDFETTSAFLAQIIETTRESAETAGTALKTVVARFSEVKKLVSEEQLKGQDEEGQLIDVNKVQAALRTAGIDLNKYFLGEVGLDDIFMELASKWDSLTSVQQRYIATQAAGSRQQSRFIALMQDYARTQELVSAAYNAEGASQKQFEKTQDSLQSKLARLKNAWNEFLMGITNSSLIKGAVEGLTILLNIVNKLTGAFGSGVGGVLKFGAALGTIAGLRNAFKSGGIAEKVMGSLGNTWFGSLLGLGGNTAAAATEAGVGFRAQVDAAGAEFAAAVRGAAGVQTITGGTTTGVGSNLRLTPWQAIQQFKANNVRDPVAYKTFKDIVDAGETNPYYAQQMQFYGAPKTLFGALGNAFVNKTKIGGGISKGLDKIGKVLGLGSGTALGGAATLATALGGIAAAAGVAYIAIKKIYDASPEGQLKKAEKYAEAISEIAGNARKAASEMRDVQQKTSDYETQIREATSSGDREKAIQDQNEYILSLLEKNATYAQYIQSSFTSGGQLYLTLDSDALAAAVDKISEGATRASAFNQFGQAIVAQQRADLYRKRLSQSQVYTISNGGTPAEQALAKARVEQLRKTDSYRNFQYQSQIDAANLAMQQYTKIATGQLIDTLDLNIDNVEQELISSVIAENFNADNLQEQADEVKKTLNDAAFLESEYFRLFGVELEKGYDKEQAKSSVALGKAVEESVGKEIPDLTSIVTDSNSKLLLEVLAGSYEGAPQEIKAAIRGLTEGQKQIFADFLEVGSNNIQQVLHNRYQNLLKDQEAFRKESVNTLTKAGVTNIKLLDNASKKLKVSQLKQLTDFANQWSDYGKEFNNELLSKTTLAMLNGGTYGRLFEDFASGITDNPVLTLQHIKQAAESAYPAIQSVAKLLLEINEPQFSQKNQLQYFLTSGEYENLGEQISKLIEANGEINSYNIEELANSSKTLSAMLDMGTMSANGLANAINALEAGNITILDLNEKVIELYESFDTTASAIERASYFIANFDPGKDYSEAINFVEDLAEKMQDLLDKGYLGNLEGYGKAMFANPPDPGDVEGWQNAITMLQQAAGNGGLDFWSNFVGLNVDESGFMDMDLAGFAESGITNYVDYIKSRTAENLPEGFNFSDAFYDLMLENARLHDAGAFEDIAAIELGKIMDAYGQATPTQADIQSIADAYGLEPQAVLDAWAQRWGKEPLDFSQLQNKVRESYTDIADLTELAFSDAINNGISTSEAAYKYRQGVPQLLKQLGIGPDGSFSVDQLRLKIGQIVPEVADGSISADDWLSQEVFKDGPVKLPVEFTTTKKVGDEWVTDTFKTDVLVNSLEEYEAAAKQIQSQIQQQNIFEDSQTYASNLVATLQQLNDISGIGTIKADIEAAESLADGLQTKLSEEVDKTVNINPSASQITVSGGSGTITLSIGVAANGGYVASAAQGGNILSPGLALTGEEDPEIVWNKNKGYAYLTGKDGPEIQNLQPGDRVFDGNQTKDILKRSKIGSFASTRANARKNRDFIQDYVVPKMVDGSTYWTKNDKGNVPSVDNSSSKSSDDWKKDLDWLYNLMEDIAELERIQSILSEKHDQYLEDIAKTGRDLYNLTNEQLNNLYTQRDNYQEALTRRLQEMREQVTENELSNYAWWNDEDQTIEIDWDAINEITDKDQYDKVTDLISKAEKIQDEIDDAQDALLDINGQIAELEKRYLQEYIDLQKRVYDAVVYSYQQQIDQLTSLNETLDDSNSQILSSLQKEIELQRQIRDNTDTENSIKELEARLAFLRRDTSGANELEIKELEQQLEDARQDYTDKLIDQAIEKLEESNSEASEQRQRQIDLLTEQLDYWKEVGALWPEVAKLLDEGINGDGSLIRGSNLEKILQNAEEWKGMSQEQRDVWANELILSVNQAGAYLIKMSEGFDNLSKGIWALIPESSIPAGERQYTTGGLVTSTGHAWLDGTRSEPEYVLNTRQTDAFLKLAEILPSIFNSGAGTTNNFGGNVYVELNMSVGEIGSDYDVDRLIERMRDDIYSASTYRNVNVVSSH